MAYAKERRQFGRRLCEFQGLQWRFAEMKLKLDSARLLLYRAASNADAGLPSELETALAKLACNRAGFEVANDALQVFGGYGYDQDAPVNYMFRRTRGWMIAGGSIEQLLNRRARRHAALNDPIEQVLNRPRQLTQHQGPHHAPAAF